LLRAISNHKGEGTGPGAILQRGSLLAVGGVVLCEIEDLLEES